MKRTFIAVKIIPGEKMKAIYNHFREDLSREKIKWVDIRSMHITLCFLGETRKEIIPQMKQEISETVRIFPPIVLNFHGCGVFRNIRDPKVIWIGLKRNGIFSNLKKNLDESLRPFGFVPEKREFKPHLTLARVKWIRNISTLEDLLQEYKDEQVQDSRINEVIFYESILKQEGPEYIPLLTAKLDGLAK